ncbi:sterol desaturase family protein [Streptomyces chitinivorans]|uniref:Sterol desaturase family protein n=1 Tax=Streptomyces chitinivorans TaxID=1257027 RepID=A0ABW7HWL3_9ACTN|nr:sterol desaturase family protein [Streptomyces chitinivorans]MDH2412318.1 sterol desaturase family protein [Streptomyces chitinivorans]
MTTQSRPTRPRTGRAERLRASPPLFRSPFLDRFTRVHPAVPVALYGPPAVLLAALAAPRLGWAALAGHILLGYALWTLTEYWVHRALFHLTPRSSRGRRLHWMVHGVHHDHPDDPRRLVMPPPASLLLTGLPFAALHLALDGGAANAVAAGFTAGYVVYDELHFLLHRPSPPTALGRRLRRHHLRHHFQDDSRGFGVSCPYWDHAFGTAPKRPAPGRTAAGGAAVR